MSKFSLNKILVIGLTSLITQLAWAVPERLSEISIDSVHVDGELRHRPCPKGFQGDCPAGTPSSCLLVIGSSLSGSITITNHSGITALNITTDTNFLSTLDVYQSPESGIPSLAPQASAILNFYASGIPVNPPITIQVKGSNTIAACFSLQVSPF